MAETSAVPWREVFRGRRGRLTAGLLLLEALFAVQALVVATIMPDVRRDLGMVQLYGLAFTATSLATIAAVPVAGRAVDRYGPATVLVPALGSFAAGLLVSATAPAMPVLLVGQFLQGAGAGALYTLSIGTIAKTYPDRMRARVLALLASMWILPGLVGPGLGALIASTVGWRWAFVVPLPVLAIGWYLIAPALGEVPAAGQAEHLPLRWPLQLMVGAGLAFTSMTLVRWWAIPIFAAGLALAIPALTRIVPRGTFSVRPGLPAAAAAAFLLSLGFLAVDAFVTLMLTEVRGLSLGEASVAITVATLTWAGGSAWQSGRTERLALGRLLSIGVALVAVGEAGVATGLVVAVPVVVAYVGWAIVGAGMGISFPTIPLSAMRASAVGEEAGQVSAVLLADMLGAATGAGLGGGMIATARAAGAPVTAGLAGAFALGIAAMLVLLALARRIPGAAPAGV